LIEIDALKNHFERLMTVDIPLSRGNFMLLFSADTNTAKNHSERLMTGLIIGVPVVGRLGEMRDTYVFYSQRLPAPKMQPPDCLLRRCSLAKLNVVIQRRCNKVCQP
jgi:hypothetical protein